MLWNSDFLFLHIPKTAGKSLTKAFVQLLDRPVTCVVSKGQIEELKDCDHAGLTIIEGRGHESMKPTRKILVEHKKEFETFKAIIVAIRNPYDLMVSNYFFMRKTYEHNKHRVNFRIAEENNFEDYSQKVGFTTIENWMTIDGKRPPNLRIIRFENLQEDLDNFSKEFKLNSVKLPHINPSSHDHYSKYLTKISEAAIYRKLKYLFDEGFYERHYFSS